MIGHMDIDRGDIVDGDSEFIPWQIGAVM